MIEFIAEYYESLIVILGISYLTARFAGYVHDKVFSKKD